MEHKLVIVPNPIGSKALPHAKLTGFCSCQWQAHGPDKAYIETLHRNHLGKQRQIKDNGGIVFGHK